MALPLPFEPAVDRVVDAVRGMVAHRRCAAREWTPDQPLEDHGPVVEHIRQFLAVRGTPVWWLPERQTMILITEAAKIPIAVVRDLWVVLRAHNLQCAPADTVHTLELVSRHPLPAVGTTQDPAIVVLSWLSVLIRPLEHHQVPPQRLIPRSECPWPAAVLPRLLRTDPIARYLGLRVGEVVHIRRCPGDPEREHDYYRLVV